MPVNSFDDYPLTWKPGRTLLKSPIYLSLAALLERDIISGRLAPNTKLPPQRELADFLDISLSTVTRTFKRCENKGLLYAVVGRGTFVSPNAALPGTNNAGTASFIQLGSIRPYYQFNAVIAGTAKAILQAPNSEKLFEFDSTLGTSRQKQVARQWLAHFQVIADLKNILLTAGTQNGLVMTLLALFHAGDKIATDTYTYYNFIGLAKQLHIQLVPIAADANGMLPDALEKQRKTMKINGIYLMPACANPTGIRMPSERRRDIATVISRSDMILIEDDAYGFTIGHTTTPIAAIIPEHTVYLHGLSKSLAAGLRIAYLVCPNQLRDDFLNAANAINLKIPLLNAEIATELIDSGKAAEIIQKKCLLSQERNKVFKAYFPAHTATNPYSFFQWLPLPKSCNGYHFEVQAKNHGVGILCSDRFAVGSAPGPSAVRLATCSPATTDDLDKGLQMIEKLIKDNRTIQREAFIV